MDELDEKLQAMAQEYQEPPPLDREKVWSRLRAQRAAAAPDVVQLRPRPSAAGPRRFASWATAIAAVLAIGFVLGRGTAPAGSNQQADPQVVAASPTQPTALSIAAAGHIRQAETYLTLFRASVRGGPPEAAVIPAARELLATNRLLASAPGTDPRMRQLLLDLELVLVQIAQLEENSRPEDVQLITDGLDRAGTLTRLRTATPRIPASLTTGVS